MKLTHKIEREVKKMKGQSGRRVGLSPIVAGAAGIAVGASVVAALNDKKTKDKLEKMAGDIKGRVAAYIEKENIEPKVKSKAKEIRKTIKTAGNKRSVN